MLKVTRKVLITCCLIILVSWVLQNVCEGFTQQQEEELKKQNEKLESVTPDPIQKAMTYEIGTISTDYGDTVALVRKNIIAKSSKCKYECVTIFLSLFPKIITHRTAKRSFGSFHLVKQ